MLYSICWYVVGWRLYKYISYPTYLSPFSLSACTDGQFPINLSKFQVEKDHAFLDQADIDSLIRYVLHDSVAVIAVYP